MTSTSNVTGRRYDVVSTNDTMSCATIYLISYKLCRIQYVGETSQPLRKSTGIYRELKPVYPK